MTCIILLLHISISVHACHSSYGCSMLEFQGVGATLFAPEGGDVLSFYTMYFSTASSLPLLTHPTFGPVDSSFVYSLIHVVQCRFPHGGHSLNHFILDMPEKSAPNSSLVILYRKQDGQWLTRFELVQDTFKSSPPDNTENRDMKKATSVGIVTTTAYYM